MLSSELWLKSFLDLIQFGNHSGVMKLISIFTIDFCRHRSGLHILNMSLGAYLPKDRYVNHFYCSTFGQNMVIPHICLHILNKTIDLLTLHTGMYISNMLTDC